MSRTGDGLPAISTPVTWRRDKVRVANFEREEVRQAQRAATAAGHNVPASGRLRAATAPAIAFHAELLALPAPPEPSGRVASPLRSTSPRASYRTGSPSAIARGRGGGAGGGPLSSVPSDWFALPSASFLQHKHSDVPRGARIRVDSGPYHERAFLRSSGASRGAPSHLQHSQQQPASRAGGPRGICVAPPDSYQPASKPPAVPALALEGVRAQAIRPGIGSLPTSPATGQRPLLQLTM